MISLCFLDYCTKINYYISNIFIFTNLNYVTLIIFDILYYILEGEFMLMVRLVGSVSRLESTFQARRKSKPSWARFVLGRGTTSRAELVSTPRSNYETQQRGSGLDMCWFEEGKPTERKMGGAEGDCEQRGRETGELRIPSQEWRGSWREELWMHRCDSERGDGD